MLRRAQRIFLEEKIDSKEEAWQLLRMAALTMDPDCLAEVAACYELESVDPEDHLRAREMYERLRSRGSFKGAYLLARSYYIGISVPVDLGLAHLYFNEAARLGHITSKIMSNQIRRHGHVGTTKRALAYLSYPISYFLVFFAFLFPSEGRLWKLEDFYPQIASKLK